MSLCISCLDNMFCNRCLNIRDKPLSVILILIFGVVIS